MAATGRAALQVVKVHSPLISFPNRLNLPKPNVQEVLKMAVAAAQSSPTFRSVRPGQRSSPDSPATIGVLPDRYRRRALDHEEMDYIQRGGPE